MRYVLVLLCSLLLCKTLQAEPIKVGTIPFYPPFEMSSGTGANSIFYGFDIEIMRALCTRAGMQCQFSTFEFQDLLAAVRDGRVDMGIAAISMTPVRQKSYLFSLPYLQSNAQFMVRQTENKKNIEDLKGSRFGYISGTLFAELIKARFGEDARVTGFENTETLIDALANNRVDSIILDADSVDFWVSTTGTLLKKIGEPLKLGTGYGIITRLGNDVLMNRINKALLDIQNDGSYLKVYRYYF